MCNSALSLWQIWFFGGISNSGGSLPKYRSNFTKLVPTFQWGKGDDHYDHDASTCTCTCRVGLTAPSSSSKVLPVVFLLPLVYYLRKHLSLSILDWFWGVSNFFGSQCKIQGKIDAQIYFGHNFWLEGPTDLRSTLLSYIFHALFRDTPLGHVYRAQPNSQIAKLAKYLDIWLFGYLDWYDEHSQVGYSWKEHKKCSSEALTWGP